MSIHVYQIIKNRGLGPYNSLSHADNWKYFLCVSVSLTRNRKEVHVSLGEGSGKNFEMFLLKKGNFFLISEFKYGQAWKKWPSPLSLLLYSIFKS